MYLLCKEPQSNEGCLQCCQGYNAQAPFKLHTDVNSEARGTQGPFLSALIFVCPSGEFIAVEVFMHFMRNAVQLRKCMLRNVVL
jgi:hypothetical protein